MESGEHKDASQVDIMLRFLRNNKTTATLIVIGIFLVSFNEVTESGENTLRRLGLIKTFNTSVETNRGQFSARFIENAWNRMFWMRAYTERIRIKASDEEQLRAYNKYIDASETWSSQLMNYYLWFDEYYPSSGKREILQLTIQPKLIEISKSIRYLKFSSKNMDDSLIIAKIDSVQSLVDDVNYDFYALIDQQHMQDAK